MYTPFHCTYVCSRIPAFYRTVLTAIPVQAWPDSGRRIASVLSMSLPCEQRLRASSLLEILPYFSRTEELQFLYFK